MYVLSRSLSQGVRAGIISATGIFIGCFLHIIAAVFGLSIIIAKSVFLFDLIKFIGAVYLIYLGCNALFTRPDLEEDIKKNQGFNKRKLLKQGIFTNIFNPKVALFFLSFLPQFADAASPFFKWQLFTLGIWFNIQGTLILVIVAWLSGKTSGFIKKHRRLWNIQQKLTGLILIILGIKLALTSKK
jgi:threonine/homoserine/homoserine lactone efflux protein